MENCRLVLAVYCEFFLLSYTNTLPMFLPPPSVRFQHLTCWTMGRWPCVQPLPRASQDATQWCSTSPDWKLGSPELSLPQSLVPFSTFCSFKALFFKDVSPPMPIPSLLSHTTFHSLLCRPYSQTSSRHQVLHTHGCIMARRSWGKPAPLRTPHVLTSFPPT